MTELIYAGRSDTGRVRERNEDRWSVDAELGLFIVSDGMGGKPAGDTAAEVVVTVLPELVATHIGNGVRLHGGAAVAGLRAALAELSVALHDAGARNPHLMGMGATVVAAVVRGNRALIGHLGDSRAYLWRSGRLRLLTHDHSVAQALVDAGEISAQERDHHRTANQLTRFVGQDSDAPPAVRRLTLRPDDRLLLCTDGLTGMLGGGPLRTALDTHPYPDDTCRALVDAANEAGGRDNITAVVVAIPAADKTARGFSQP